MADQDSTARIAGESERLLAGLFKAARNATLAGIGIVGAVGEEAEAAYRRSIARGESRVRQLEDRLGLRGKLMREPFTIDGAPSRHAPQAAEDLRATLSRLNLADPTDLEELRRQVDELEAKIEQLAAE